MEGQRGERAQAPGGFTSFAGGVNVRELELARYEEVHGVRRVLVRLVLPARRNLQVTRGQTIGVTYPFRHIRQLWAGGWVGEWEVGSDG